MLLTSKHENSICYNQALQYIVRENKPCTVVVIIDATWKKECLNASSKLPNKVPYEILHERFLKVEKLVNQKMKAKKKKRLEDSQKNTILIQLITSIRIQCAICQ